MYSSKRFDSHIRFWYALDELILPQAHWNLCHPVQRVIDYTIDQLDVITHVDVYRHLCAILAKRCPRDGRDSPPSISLG